MNAQNMHVRHRAAVMKAECAQIKNDDNKCKSETGESALSTLFY